jgi:hypothetical protein
VQVHYDEGVAIHIGLEPCVFVREGECEASVEVRIGQPLSCERNSPRVADVLASTEGNSGRRVSASVCCSRRGHRPWHVRKLLVRELGDPILGRRVVLSVCIGKARSRSR